MTLSDNGTSWGGSGNANALTIDSWSDTAITFNGADAQRQWWLGARRSGQ